MMRAMPEKPATTPIAVQLSASEFTQFLLPHLTTPKRGPRCKLGDHRVFNLIFWLLYTGMQWKCASNWYNKSAEVNFMPFGQEP